MTKTLKSTVMLNSATDAKPAGGDYKHETAGTIRCQHQAPCSSVAGRTPAQNHSLTNPASSFTQNRLHRPKEKTKNDLLTVGEQRWGCAGRKWFLKKRERISALWGVCRRDQRVTYKGCWRNSGLSWANRTRSDPARMQMRSAPSGEKVRSTKASSSQTQITQLNIGYRDASCFVFNSEEGRSTPKNKRKQKKKRKKKEKAS